MKLDAKLLRYLTQEEFRVITAVEMGSKNHEVVPTQLISQIAQLRHGGAHKILGKLAKYNLVAKVQNNKYDGYRLTYGGYDYLALKTFSKRNSVYSVGNQIGVGKESDIYIVADEHNVQRVLKIQRLGRVSFRTIKANRDYLQNRKSASWMYMSRLAALKEYAFMKALYEHDFPVPEPIDSNRHCVVMGLVDGTPLSNVNEVADAGKLYSELMDLIVRLASYGLIHGDFNEFNVLVTDSQVPILIDFPQMVSTSHRNAREYFDRDVNCIRTFFRRRFNYESSKWPRFDRDVNRTYDLDVAVSASGFSSTHQRELEELMQVCEHDQGDSNNDSDTEAQDDNFKHDTESNASSDEEDTLTSDDMADNLEALQIDGKEEVVHKISQDQADKSKYVDHDLVETIDDVVAPINNKNFRAFRDKPEPSENSTTQRYHSQYRQLDPGDIKRRVSAAMENGKHHVKLRGNKTKDRGKRKNSDVVKEGGVDNGVF